MPPFITIPKNKDYTFVDFDEIQPFTPLCNSEILDTLPVGTQWLDIFRQTQDLSVSNLAALTLTLKPEYHKLSIPDQRSLLESSFEQACGHFDVPYFLAFELTVRNNVHGHAIAGLPLGKQRLEYLKELRRLGFITNKKIYDLEGAIEYCLKYCKK